MEKQAPFWHKSEERLLGAKKDILSVFLRIGQEVEINLGGGKNFQMGCQEAIGPSCLCYVYIKLILYLFNLSPLEKPLKSRTSEVKPLRAYLFPNV